MKRPVNQHSIYAVVIIGLAAVIQPGCASPGSILTSNPYQTNYAPVSFGQQQYSSPSPTGFQGYPYPQNFQNTFAGSANRGGNSWSQSQWNPRNFFNPFGRSGGTC